MPAPYKGAPKTEVNLSTFSEEQQMRETSFNISHRSDLAQNPKYGLDCSGEVESVNKSPMPLPRTVGILGQTYLYDPREGAEEREGVEDEEASEQEKEVFEQGDYQSLECYDRHLEQLRLLQFEREARVKRENVEMTLREQELLDQERSEAEQRQLRRMEEIEQQEEENELVNRNIRELRMFDLELDQVLMEQAAANKAETERMKEEEQENRRLQENAEKCKRRYDQAQEDCRLLEKRRQKEKENA
jgi:hypothetical protein